MATEEDARQLLQEDQLIPYRLITVRPRRNLVQIVPSLFQPKPKEVIEFTRGLSSLLRSGIPMREALVILRAQSGSMGMKEVLRRVIQDIEGGDRFSDACSFHPRVFTDFYISLLRVGEAGGAMAVSLQQLADTLEKRKAIRDKVRAALVYPMVSLGVALIVAVILVTYSLPALVGLLTEYGGTLPTNTKMLITVSNFVQSYNLYIFITIGSLVGLSSVGFRTKIGSRLRDRLLLKTPIVSEVLVRSNLYSLTSTFSRLLNAGIPTIESLELSKESLNNVIFQERLANVIQAATSGERLGSAFRIYWPSPPLLSQAITTGEASGGMADALNGLADFFEQEATRSVSAATELIQPAVILLVAALVGFVATAVISGIYSAIGSVR